MSFDATRSAWSARAAGAIESGPALYVALAMADRAHSRTGELQAGTRGLAELLGLSPTTVTAALRDLQAGGIVEATERGIGTRPTRWRWMATPQRYPNGTQTGFAEGGDNTAQRATSVTQGEGLALPKNRQRARRGALACQESNETRTRVYKPGENGWGQPDALVAPDDVPAQVALLRQNLDGRRGAACGAPPSVDVSSAPPTDEAPPVAPDGWVIATTPEAVAAIERLKAGQRRGIIDPVDPDDDGWAP